MNKLWGKKSMPSTNCDFFTVTCAENVIQKTAQLYISVKKTN